MAKLVDAPSSGGGAARCAGSNPVLGTNPDRKIGICFLEEYMLRMFLGFKFKGSKFNVECCFKLLKLLNR